MSKFLSNNLKKVEAYVPGEQPQDKSYIKLNTNESPFPPSSSVIKAINEKATQSLRLYCDPTCKVLKEKLAKVYCTEAENVFVGNGSDEILNFIFMAYGEKGVAYADITYGFYSVFAKLYNLNSTVIPLKEDYSLDYKAFFNQNKLRVIASPNAPTGIEVSASELEEILISNKESIVVVDQAYVDFGGTDVNYLTKKYDNLICTYTFSKSRSMAGARLGFAIANKSLILDLEKIKYSTNPYNVNTLTQIAGYNALVDDEYYKNNAKLIQSNRQFTTLELEKLGFEVLPSKANFVFAKNKKISGKKLYLKLKEQGVLIRHFDKERISDFIRITIGSLEEMQIFINKIKNILGELKWDKQAYQEKLKKQILI